MPAIHLGVRFLLTTIRVNNLCSDKNKQIYAIFIMWFVLM